MERVKVLPSKYSQSKASETGGQTKEHGEAEEGSREAVEDSFSLQCSECQLSQRVGEAEAVLRSAVGREAELGGKSDRFNHGDLAASKTRKSCGKVYFIL